MFDKNKKNKKKLKIIAGVVGSTALVGAVASGITVVAGIEENEEENKKTKNLEVIIPSNKRNLGKIYIGQISSNIRHKKIEMEIKDIIKNTYKIDITKIKIQINNSQNQAIISSKNKNMYVGVVTLNYIFDTSFVTLDYIVPNINERSEQVSTYNYSHHQDIVSARNDILRDSEFRNLPELDNFINKLNYKVKYKASKESINSFKKIENNNDNFENFENLDKQFNDYHFLFNGRINFQQFILTISDYWTNQNNYKPWILKNGKYIKENYINVNSQINEMKQEMCRFYNILAQVYEKNNVFKMLQKIEFDQQLLENTNGVVGRAYSGSCDNDMCTYKIVLDTDNFKDDWKYGMEVMAHEYGHILDYLISDILFKKGLTLDAREYMIASLANGTKINNKAYQKLLTYGIVRSSYGRISKKDLFAEAFGRWIMTPEINRDLGWEKLDKFFRIDLPNIL
ncbi:MAG: hypothetical protein PPFGHCPK_01506 (plasmid) [Spiroplasma endosymbiont of Drosophila atripex]|nr:MAG: hypothetical protein PPFGHCPK_01506 [Spiroplasma endosymbiont of Drosophila atripex]